MNLFINSKSCSLPPGGLKRQVIKILITMKLTVIFVLAVCIHVSAESYAQKVTLSGNNVSMEKLFKDIKSQTGYIFFYDKSLMKKARPVTIQVKDALLENALDICFRDQPLTYSIIGQTIVVKQKVPTIPDYQVTQVISAITEVNLSKTITGKVTDEEGKALEGVSVMVKDKKIGTMTDEKGFFTIDVPDDAKALEFSRVGYSIVTININHKTSINAVLKLVLGDMDDVVITGLFSRPTENFTGVATSVTGDQLRAVNSMNVFDALKVFDPAVRIPDNLDFGSDPNRLPNISLRGTNNFPGQSGNVDIPSSSADFMAAYQTNPSMPLFMLDGFEVSLSKIYDLDINRIEKIVVLKDAVATSAYGSRAANGVIVVETKQPQAGKLTVNYNTTVQVTAPDLTSYHLLNARDKLELERVSGLYTTERPEYQLILSQRYSKRRAEIERGVDTYWLSQPLETGIGTKQTVYIEGGDAYVRYGATFGYTNDKGVMKGSGRENLEGAMNLSYRFKGFLLRNQLTVNSNISNNSPYGSFDNYTHLNPYWNPYDEKGNVKKVLETITGFGVDGQSVIANPLYNAGIGTLNKGKYLGFINNLFLEWRFMNGFKLTGKLGITSQNDESNVFLPADHTTFSNITDYNSEAYKTRGSFDKSNSGFSSYDASLVLDYSKAIGRHILYATAGVSTAEQRSKMTAISVRGFPNDRLDEIFYGNEYLNGSRPTGTHNITRRFSSYANFNYTFDKRFLFDLALNVDGSTQFGELNRFAPFWAVGVGWNLHEEKFMQGVDIFKRLKIRGGMGTTGSQQFPPYLAITTYGYNTSQDYLGLYGASVLGYGNPNLKWQETTKYNLGMDASLLNDRFSFRLDAYYEETNNLLLDISTPPSLGVLSYKENMGKLSNKGIEGSINAFIFMPNSSGFTWSVFINGIHNRNQIKEISNSLKKMNEDNDKNTQSLPQQRYKEGESVNAIWAVKSAGIDPSTGQELFYDLDGNLTYIWSAKDKVIVGDNIPQVSGNLGTNVTFRGVQFGAYFNYQVGAKQYNQTLADYVENADISYNVDERVFQERWQKPGDVTFFKGLTNVEGNTVTSITNVTSRFIQKNNFLDFASISLGYLFPEEITGKWGIKNTRFTVQANNILQLSTIQIERGRSYPFARMITFNLSTSF